MAENVRADAKIPEPRGFGEHTKGLAGEYAHEQGWGLNEAERTAVPQGRQPGYGGAEYDYGAQDFGDEATDMTGSEGGSAEGLEKDVQVALGAGTQGGGARDVGDKGATDTKTEGNEKE